MSDNYKYTPFPYDTFFNRLTDDTGITLVINHKTKCLKIDKLKTEQWVELFRNTQNNGIETFEVKPDEEWDSKTQKWIVCEKEIEGGKEDEKDVEFRADSEDDGYELSLIHI